VIHEHIALIPERTPPTDQDPLLIQGENGLRRRQSKTRKPALRGRKAITGTGLHEIDQGLDPKLGGPRLQGFYQEPSPALTL
jgi:hypothetical protein